MRKRGKRFTTRADPSAFIRALVGTQPLDQGQQTDLSIGYRMAFQSMLTGQGKEHDFHTIACSLNIALVLAERGYGAEWVEQVKDAQDGLMRCQWRGQKTGLWGLDGPAINAFREAMALHDEQIAMASQRDVRLAIAEVQKRLIRGDTLKMETK